MILRPPASPLFPYTTLFRSQHRAGAVELLDHMGVVGADEALEHLRAAGGAHAARAQNVLVGERNPGERAGFAGRAARVGAARDRKSTRLNSSHANISYAVFC